MHSKNPVKRLVCGDVGILLAAIWLSASIQKSKVQKICTMIRIIEELCDILQSDRVMT